ncbi:MAG TPA: DegT/DnrJ/EryC1/StrS family aminotransferase [Tepidisphaeraceae bacterium]|nr:DegT/DnrJ/EryC1/StrS family aminotransferase [Tepidisphaeraceae bacterium]
MRQKHQPDQPIPWAKPAIDDAELNEVIACMKSGWLTCGPRVTQFEKQMAVRAGRTFAVAVSNGTAALDVALRAAGIGPGDEVIVPALSYIATASTVAIVGATPVFCDVDPRNLGMDPVSAASRITPRTRAILCTDHGGNPCDFDVLLALARRHGVPLILDGAQSIGATFNGKPALSHGLISTVSFHAAKTITTVEGGMAFTDDPALARRMRIIRSQGEDPDRKYHHIELGHNFRMTELQAAVGLAQLAKLDALLANRQQLAHQYQIEFAGLGLQPPPGVPGGHNSFFLFSVLTPHRDRAVQRLKSRGIETRVCYPAPLYAQPIFSQYKTDPCPVAERICASILNPPMFFGLTRIQQQRVSHELRDALKESARAAA